MPECENIRIRAENIDDAAGEIIGLLEDTSKGNLIYFRGWYDFGASATLKAVAQRLKSSKSKFDKVIHLDCSVWKCMRALQKAIAEELELPRSVLAILDRCDEDDDFKGIEQGSRGVIVDVGREICTKLLNSRFVVVFHNGSRRYVDLYDCGVPAIPFLRNKVLWTWRGRFQRGVILDDGELEKMRMHTNVFLYYPLRHEDKELQYLVVHEEAEEVANCMSIAEPGYLNHKVVKQCVMYGLLLSSIASAAGLDLDTHGPNYWVCDGIIQGQGSTSAWEIGNSLQRNMPLDWMRKNHEDAYYLAELLEKHHGVYDGSSWVYVTHKKLRCGNTVMAPAVTSLFLYADESPTNTMPMLPVSMFQHSQNSKLRVLHLSRCTFSFASPPFRCCSQLRFLHLDHCTSITDNDESQSHNENISCFQKLWVLDLRYTEWYCLLSEKMKILMVDLRELNVEGVKHGSISDLCGGRPSLVIVRVTEADPVPTENKDTNNQAQFAYMSSTNSLTTSRFVKDVLPPRLESFSFINKAATAAKIFSFSFQGCSRLKSILLGGNLGSLEELDLSGTAVKTLDLREVEARNLKRLILMGCEKLRSILWPPEEKRTRVLEKLHISTILSASPSRNNWEENTKEATSFDFNWYISVVDPRLMWSLMPFRRYIERIFVYMEIDSSSASEVAGGGREVGQGLGMQQQTDQCSYARDVFKEYQQAVCAIEGVISWMWDCPPIRTPSPQDWYFHMQDEEKMERGTLQRQHITQRISTDVALAPVLMCDNAKMLYVHDSSSTTCIPCPQGAEWPWLEWCRVERCPKLRSVFATYQLRSGKSYRRLRTFWASQLPMACYIWNWNKVYRQPYEQSFEDLQFMHLDYCPRLIHVLPLSKGIPTLPSLETLEIVCCGNLKEVFPLDPKRQEKQEIIEFPNLRRIHLYELPMLQRICGSRISAPNLETVKIRGCWGLRRLPSINGNTTKWPKVGCEKDWWDNLEWDGVEANHDPSLYEPSHSRYYKKAHLPRDTVLR